MHALDLQTQIVVADDVMTVKRTQDCTPIAEYCKTRQIEGRHGDKEFKLAAKIPYVIIEKYCNDNSIDFSEFMRNPEHMKRVCNDPALSHFRVWPGRV